MGPGYDYHGLMITAQPYNAYQVHAYTCTIAQDNYTQKLRVSVSIIIYVGML